jgi:3-oxoacyl-(acyl-carrier-protein) synthase
MALEAARLNPMTVPPEQLLVSIGTSMNGIIDVHEPSFSAFLRGESPGSWAVLEFPAHSATSHVAIAAGARGQTNSLATACAAGLDAIAWAGDRVAASEATAVIAGGTETPLSPYSLEAFHSVGVLSQWTGPPHKASRPFDRDRSGLVLAEGAAVVIVEEEEHAKARGAPICARILGAASATEGEHLRKVDTGGATVARVVIAALERSRLVPSDIDYISAHGNSMIDYDIAETSGLKAALGRHSWNVPISSLKSMCGHALAAAGAMQVVAACLTIRHQEIAPTINYEHRDPACDLDYVPNVRRVARIRNVLVHAHSMGGSHTALILGMPS